MYHHDYWHCWAYDARILMYFTFFGRQINLFLLFPWTSDVIAWLLCHGTPSNWGILIVVSRLCIKRGYSAVAVLVTWRCLLSQCEKLTNYLAHMQLQYICRKKTEQKCGANPSARKILKTSWAGKKGKGAMPEKGHRTSFWIKVFFPVLKQRSKNASLMRKKNKSGCVCFLKECVEAVFHSRSTWYVDGSNYHVPAC